MEYYYKLFICSLERVLYGNFNNRQSTSNEVVQPEVEQNLRSCGLVQPLVSIFNRCNVVLYEGYIRWRESLGFLIVVNAQQSYFYGRETK